MYKFLLVRSFQINYTCSLVKIHHLRFGQARTAIITSISLSQLTASCKTHRSVIATLQRHSPCSNWTYPSMNSSCLEQGRCSQQFSLLSFRYSFLKVNLNGVTTSVSRSLTLTKENRLHLNSSLTLRRS